MITTHDTDDETLESALSTLRDGVATRDDETERVSTLMDIARDRGVPPKAMVHPKTTQALFRYEFGPEGVRGEIDRGIDTYRFDTCLGDVLAVLVAAAEQIEESSQTAPERE